LFFGRSYWHQYRQWKNHTGINIDNKLRNTNAGGRISNQEAVLKIHTRDPRMKGALPANKAVTFLLAQEKNPDVNLYLREK
jgi:hypothetical protein